MAVTRSAVSHLHVLGCEAERLTGSSVSPQENICQAAEGTQQQFDEVFHMIQQAIFPEMMIE